MPRNAAFPPRMLRLVHPAQYLPALKFAHETYSPQAARDGMEFVKTRDGMEFEMAWCPCLEANPVRPASRWKRSGRKEGAESPPLSDRAAGVLGEVVKVMGRVKPVCRRAVLGRRVATFQFQC